MGRPTTVGRFIVGFVGLAVLASSMTSAASADVDSNATRANVSNTEIHFANDDSGCEISPMWEMCVYYQHGLDSVVRVVPDDSKSAGRDGSLRIATPGQGDRVRLWHTLDSRYGDGPPLAEFIHGGYAVRVLRRAAPDYSMTVECTPGTGDEAGMTYAGPLPEAGSGWRDVDMVQDGQALWTFGGGTLSLDQIKALCPQGTILGHGLTQDTAGSESRVDAVQAVGVTNFWIPTLLRVHGRQFPWGSPPLDVAQRGRAYALAEIHFGSGRPYGWQENYGADWTFPARSRRPPARAAVVAAQDSFQSLLVAGPLANAVSGPLVLSPSHKLTSTSVRALDTVRRGSRVFLVGDREQLSGMVARALRERNLRVVRVAGRSHYGTAVEVARLIDRRRSAGTPRSLLVTSGTRSSDALSVAAAAGARSGAVLLTRGRTMPAVTRRYLASHRPSVVHAVGRHAALAMPGLADGRKIVGRNRYATAVEVARRFFADPTSAVFAVGNEPTDALLAASYGGHKEGPLLLVRPHAVPRIVARYVAARRDTVRASLLVADETAVPESTFEALLRRLRPR